MHKTYTRLGRPCEEAEIGLVWLQAKEHQILPANNQKLGESDGAQTITPPSEGTNPISTFILEFWPLGLKRGYIFVILSPPVCVIVWWQPQEAQMSW